MSMLHRVSPEPVRAFEANRILKITPDFLDNVVRQVIKAGFDLLSMDVVTERLAARRSGRPFACFTLDDGYRDNLEYELPVFKRYGAPFTFYVATDYMDGKGDLCWLMLERAIEASDSIRVLMDGAERRFDTATVAAKDFA
jgi:peptidoglycan/xylan/chitin deacetylase (PgdA/CDA1 family)